MHGRTVRRKGCQETSFRTPRRNTLGEEKQRMGGTSTSMACKHKRKKQGCPKKKKQTMSPPNTKPAPLETQHPIPQHCKRNPTSPNQKRKPLLSMILPQVHLR